MISFLSFSLSVFSKRNVRSRRQLTRLEKSFREPLYPFPIRKFADWTFDRISPGYILKFQCPFDRSRSNGYRWIFYRARFVLLLDVQKGRGKRKTNSTIIESSIRLGSIFQSRYYLPAATFISRCDSVATVLIPSFPPFFFSFSFFGGFRYLFSRLASISPIVSHGSIKYSSIRPTSLLETCNNFVFTFPSNRRVN